MKQEKQLMDSKDITRTLTRIVHEILEYNKSAENIVVIGIRTRGVVLADRIVKKINKLEGVEVPSGIVDITLHRDDLNLNDNIPVLKNTEIDFDITGKDVILVDDVLFSGRTIRAALDELMDFGRPASVQLAVLVDRGHRQLPILANYAGKVISTSQEESIQVRIKQIDNKDEVVSVLL